MKRALVIACLLCGLARGQDALPLYAVLAGGISATVPFHPSSLAPVAWWRAENDATDTASTNVGTWSGSAAYADSTNGLGRAFSFIGINRVTIGAPAVMMGEQDTTLACWMKPAIYVNYRALFGSGTIGEGATGLGMTVLSSGVAGQYRVGDTSVTATYALSGTAWHHVALVKTAAALKLYVDGVLRDTQAHTISTGMTNPWGIGQRNVSGTWGNGFVGLIDEVFYFNRALSPTEIANLYNWRNP